MRDISILIPARNEQFLNKTIQDILSNIEANTEIIVVLDGYFVEIPMHERVQVIYNVVAKGQRAATNQAAKLSDAKYVIKTDAHCSFDKGFDRKMIEAYNELPDGDSVTMVPIMRNLHAFDWVCPDGHRRYQGPSGVCAECGKETIQDVVWIAKNSPQSLTYMFDNTLHFKYWGELAKRQTGDLIESMSLQGSFFMMTREKYWSLDICDEEFGSWGQQGVEVACKTWLSGGRVIVNKRTFYAHMFRTQGGDFGFPYEQSNTQVNHAREYSRDLFQRNKWDKAIYPFSWLLKKFGPVPTWEEIETKDLTKGVLYYTDNKLDERIMNTAQNLINEGAKDLEIVSVSLKPINFGKNIHLPLERGYLTMFKQILTGLKAMTSDVVFFCEHDVMYHPSHFEFTPVEKNKYYYNTNVWKIRASDGFAVKVDDMRQLSGLCAFRETLINHYEERVRRVEAEGFTRNMGFEPGTHNRKERVDDLKSERWDSESPNLDIRHDTNLTSNRWKKEDFRNQKYTQGWTEKNIKDIIGWNEADDLIHHT